jgi:hypothetical protein
MSCLSGPRSGGLRGGEAAPFPRLSAWTFDIRGRDEPRSPLGEFNYRISRAHARLVGAKRGSEAG